MNFRPKASIDSVLVFFIPWIDSDLNLNMNAIPEKKTTCSAILPNGAVIYYSSTTTQKIIPIKTIEFFNPNPPSLLCVLHAQQ